MDTSNDGTLMQALHDPENQPSQFGTVPSEYLDRANDLIDGLVRQFNHAGCDCIDQSNACCSYSLACAYLGRPRCAS